MDYTKVPRALIYKERKSLDDFGVYVIISYLCGCILINPIILAKAT